ncbi:MAG TPA: glycosyltransferase [Solirubrobacteraceae bacterium]|nr:glycosyltransferase [Solirubrobacteraceae bacterium]
MALRLTGSIHTDEPLPADPETVTAGLCARARTALAGGTYENFHTALAEAGEIADSQQRFRTELRVLEQGLIHARSAPESAAVRTFVAVAEGALTILDREPSEPQLLLYAGVACYELWALEGARALFGAAARLDPSLPDLTRNRTELARRLRGPRPTRPLHNAVPGLVRRARGISNRARAATGLTLSLCMIVKDEERMLPRCLEAIRPAVDEIIVVDTGSTDATMDIARSFGARVIEHPWTGSFAEPRNVSFDAAGGDWIIYLDADEVLVCEDVERLRELTGQTWREAFHLIETSFVGELGDGSAIVNTALRVFRNRPQYRFTGSIHEQIYRTLPSDIPGRVGHSSVRIEHYGYLEDTRAVKDKSSRNLALLLEQRDSGTPPTAFLHFNLGCEYAAAGDAGRATTELTSAWTMLETAGEVHSTFYAPSLLSTLVRALRLSGRPAEAISFAETGLRYFPAYTDLLLEQAAAQLDMGRPQDAQALLERCIAQGDAPAAFGGLVGSGTYLPRLALAKLTLDRDDAAVALAHLDWSIENHPGYLGVAGPYVLARRRQGAAPTSIIEELEARLTPLTPAARIAVARAFARSGAPGAAVAQYRLVLEQGDARRESAVRVALGEILLAHGEWDQAAEAVAVIPSGDPYAALACRIETAARLAAGELDEARAACARAAAVGLAQAERDLLDAWTALASGKPARQGLALGSVPLLATLLEFMFRARAQAPYAQLRALLDGSRLEPRERAQLVAEIHLRHGDPAGAAAQWLAVCAQAPDARARFGLAQVAAATGAPEDAVLFAQAALELDPSFPGPRELIALLQRSAGTPA